MPPKFEVVDYTYSGLYLQWTILTVDYTSTYNVPSLYGSDYVKREL